MTLFYVQPQILAKIHQLEKFRMQECCIVFAEVIEFSLQSKKFWNQFCQRNFLMLQTTSWQMVRTYQDVRRMSNRHWLKGKWPQQIMSKGSSWYTKTIDIGYWQQLINWWRHWKNLGNWEKVECTPRLLFTQTYIYWVQQSLEKVEFENWRSKLEDENKISVLRPFF